MFPPEDFWEDFQYDWRNTSHTGEQNWKEVFSNMAQDSPLVFYTQLDKNKQYLILRGEEEDIKVEFKP